MSNDTQIGPLVEVQLCDCLIIRRQKLVGSKSVPQLEEKIRGIVELVLQCQLIDLIDTLGVIKV